LYKSRFIFY